MNNLTVLTMIIYVATAITSFAGFSLFSFWWFQRRKATTIYVYITLLFLAMAVEQVIEGFTYYFMVTENPMGQYIVNSSIWPTRMLFVGLLMFTIVIHVISRMMAQRRRFNMFKSKSKPKPGSYYDQEVLIVDDHKEVVFLIKAGIKKLFPNVTVYTACTAEKALEIFKEHENISLIVTDILLPNMNGFELCGVLKEECPWILIIGMTGYTSVYEFWAAREVGFDDYILKPFRVFDMMALIRKELETLDRWKSIEAGRSKPEDRRQSKRKGKEKT